MLDSLSWAANGFDRVKKSELCTKSTAGRGERDRFTTKVTITKDKKKLRTFIIFKGQPESRLRENHRSVVAHELKK